MEPKHEPPSKASFYGSVATAVLRVGLVIAAVILGVVMLTKAFPTPATDLPDEPQTVLPQETESPTSPLQEESPAPEASPEVEGVTVQVLNGTAQSGLAAETAELLENEGYRVLAVANAQTSYEVTTLFYQDDSKLEARHLRQTFFGGAVLERATAQLNQDVRVTIVLGQDYAEQQG
ncbi:MAG: LytR C-terminal domain-containing protein [Actinomycetota bacterium]